MTRHCILVLIVGCGAPAASETTAGSETTASDEESQDCDGFVAQYRTTLAGATNECATDADCAVYGGLDAEAICGGAVDASTAGRLRAIGEASDAAGCPRPPYSCPSIHPRCFDDLCTAGR